MFAHVQRLPVAAGHMGNQPLDLACRVRHGGQKRHLAANHMPPRPPPPAASSTSRTSSSIPSISSLMKSGGTAASLSSGSVRTVYSETSSRFWPIFSISSFSKTLSNPYFFKDIFLKSSSFPKVKDKSYFVILFDFRKVSHILLARLPLDCSKQEVDLSIFFFKQRTRCF